MINEISTSPLLSVILPVYNAARFVGQAVDSILCQSFSDFELIVIDDGSVDGSTEILAKLAARDKRVLLISRENRGLIASLNEGIDVARGAYIVRMDADDIALPTRFAQQIAFLQQTGLDICGTSVQCFGDSHFTWSYPATPQEVEVQLLFDSPYAHPSVMGKASLFQMLRYQEDCTSVEDYDLWCRAWKSGYRGGNLQDVLLNYRVHGAQVSTKSKIAQSAHANALRVEHWSAIAGANFSAEVNKLCGLLESKPTDLVELQPLLLAVLQKYRGDPQRLYISQCFRIGAKAAATSRRPWRVWRDLLGQSECGRSRWQELGLAFLWMFALSPDHPVFIWLKVQYLRNKWR